MQLMVNREYYTSALVLAGQSDNSTNVLHERTHFLDQARDCDRTRYRKKAGNQEIVHKTLDAAFRGHPPHGT